MPVIQPRRDEPVIGPDGLPTERYSEFWENQTTIINVVEDAPDVITNLTSEVTGQSGILKRLTERVQALEESNDNDQLSSKINQLKRLVDQLIEDLIKTIEANNINDLMNKTLSMQNRINNELKLMNARIEEAFDTRINDRDISEGNT